MTSVEAARRNLDRIRHLPLQLGITDTSLRELRALGALVPGIGTLLPVIESHLRGVPVKAWCRLEAELALSRAINESVHIVSSDPAVRVFYLSYDDMMVTMAGAHVNDTKATFLQPELSSAPFMELLSALTAAIA